MLLKLEKENEDSILNALNSSKKVKSVSVHKSIEGSLLGVPISFKSDIDGLSRFVS